MGMRAQSRRTTDHCRGRVRIGAGARGLRVGLVLMAVLARGPSMAAQGTGAGVPPPPVEAGGEESSRASVTVDGELLFNVRGVSAFPAEKRAAEISARITALAADPSVSPDSLRLAEEPHWIRIYAGDTPVMLLVEADATAERVSLHTLAQATMARVKQAMIDYRQERSPAVLIEHALYALGATLVTVLILVVLLYALRWLDRTIERRFHDRVKGLETQSFRLIQAEQLWAAFHGVVQVVRVAAIVAVLYAYVNLVLSLFPWTRALGRQLFGILLSPLRAIATAVVLALPNLVFVAIVAVITRYVLRATRLFFVGIENGSIKLRNFDRDWSMPTYRIVRVLVIAFALVVSYPYIPGSQSEAFKGVSIFLGVMFTLGSSSVMASMMAGYAMTYRRAFRVGDRVKINGVVGDVIEVRLLVTRLRSLKNEEVVIPNSAILNESVLNYSTLARERGLILHTTVGIGYETPWRQVEAMLEEAAERTPGLLREPAPFVLHQALGDFAVTYELNVYCDDPQASMRLYTELHRNILDLFNEYGVQIMTPAYEGDPEQAKVVPKDQWYAAPARRPGEA